MKCCALICEYNPLHNGHCYQLRRIKELTDCDRIICIMSGDFVQRAEPAIANKLARAKCAILSGADMVVELPLPYAIGSGELFAKGAVEILKNLPNVHCLAMGCETDDVQALKTLAKIQLEESSLFKKLLDEHLKQGLSYARSYAAASEIMGEHSGLLRDMSHIILSKPNNVLCLEYLKALKRQNVNVEPVFIKRKADKKYVDEKIEITSSSIIRKRIAGGFMEDVSNAIPCASFEMLVKELAEHYPRPQTYSDIVLFALRNMSVEEIRNIAEVSEGLENPISKARFDAVDLDKLIERVKSKRYTESRLKRICLQAVFKLNNGTMTDITHPYSRIIAIKSDFKEYLSRLPDTFYIQTQGSESMSKRMFIELEKQSMALYGLITHNDEYAFPPRLITV